MSGSERPRWRARWPREREKGNTTVRYDLRPLLVDVGMAATGPPPVLRIRTRFDPVLGTGRPEEVGQPGVPAVEFGAELRGGRGRRP